MSAPFGPTAFADAEPVNPVIAGYLGKIALAASSPPKRTILHIDYETYSEVDLKKTGASVYARHPSTEILMLAYGTRNSEIKQWVPVAGEPMPDDLRRALMDPSVTIAAWNAPFEMAITEHVLGVHVPRERWLDVMVLSFSLALPGSLDKCGEVVGLGEDKKKLARGKTLIRKFCQPRKPTKNKPWTRETAETAPEEWQEFLDYNRQDVEAERSIYRRIKRWQMPDHEWAMWHLDQKINDAGIPINLNAVRAAVRLMEATVKKDLAEMRRLTGLANPNSGPQLLPWLQSKGYIYADLKKGHVARAYEWVLECMEDETADLLGLDDTLLRVLELRLRVSKASVKKYPALLAATDEDGRLRGCHQFAGAARTWRWSGRRFQPQNLSKPSKGMEKFVLNLAPSMDELAVQFETTDKGFLATERAKIGFSILVHDIEHLSVEEFWEKYETDDPEVNTMEALVAAVRPMVQAPSEDEVLIDADLSAIENVVLGWLAQDDKILRVFREGLDPYIDFAVDMFKMPYDAIKAEVDSGDKSKRTTAKPGVLGCGYMLGAGTTKENTQTGELEGTGLLGYAWGMGVDLTPEMSKLSVDTFRSKFKKVKDFWYAMDDAARKAIRTKKPQTVGYITFDISGPFLRMKLPSGRNLHYWRPRIERRKMPWKDDNGQPVYKDSITYEQIEKGQWRRVTTHPGKLTENAVQAVARDILAHGMKLADALGIDLRLHVHDQAVAVGMKSRADRLLEQMIDCLTTLPAWADNTLPLKAAGLTTPVFIKD